MNLVHLVHSLISSQHLTALIKTSCGRHWQQRRLPLSSSDSFKIFTVLQLFGWGLAGSCQTPSTFHPAFDRDVFSLPCFAIDWIMPQCSSAFGIDIGRWKLTNQVYAADAALFTSDAANWLPALMAFDSAAATIWLHTLWIKTKVQNLGSGPPASSVDVANERVESGTCFTNLGSDLDSSSYCTPEILRRIGIASTVFGRLDSVWKWSNAFSAQENPENGYNFFFFFRICANFKMLKALARKGEKILVTLDLVFLLGGSALAFPFSWDQCYSAVYMCFVVLCLHCRTTFCSGWTSASVSRRREPATPQLNRTHTLYTS